MYAKYTLFNHFEYNVYVMKDNILYLVNNSIFHWKIESILLYSNYNLNDNQGIHSSSTGCRKLCDENTQFIFLVHIHFVSVIAIHKVSLK